MSIIVSINVVDNLHIASPFTRTIRDLVSDALLKLEDADDHDPSSLSSLHIEVYLMARDVDWTNRKETRI